MPGADQQPQGIPRALHPQHRVPSAPHQLQRLGEKLDLPDAALAQFHVVVQHPCQRIRGGTGPGALVLVDPPFHGVDIGDGGEVEVPAPNEGADLLQEPGPQQQIAGHRARLEHGGTLPVLAHRFVIGDRRGQGDAGRGGRRIGPQPQIGTKDVSFRVACLHKGHKIARHPGVEASRGIAVIHTRVRVVQQDEVDIAGVVQFAGAELAHAKHGEAAIALRRGGVGQAQMARLVPGQQQMRDRSLEGGLGKVAQCLRHAFERPQPADIGDRGGERDDPLGLAQRRREGGARHAGRQRGQHAQRLGRHMVGPQLQQIAQRGGFAQCQFRQIWRIAAERAQQAARPALRQPRLGAPEIGETFDQPVGGARIGRSWPVGGKSEFVLAHAAGWP